MKTPGILLAGAIGSGMVILLGFGLLAGLLGQMAQVAANTQQNACTVAGNTVASSSSTPATVTPSPDPTTHVGSTPMPSPTPSFPAEDNLCYPASGYGAQVVQWARKMADALYVNPACGKRRGGPACNDTWYHQDFPQAVLQYGQTWCQQHGECSDWANGTYQCVSFVRGAYSQVYPMAYSNNAFGLWATYQHAPGWQEIPAAATPDLAQRGLPEPGDVMVFKDLGDGHVAIVMAVQPPHQGKNGWVAFANANSSSAYDRMPLFPSLLVDTSAWQASGGEYVVWGYIRPRPDASARVQRINQLDPAEYASHSEYATWASSACSAAAMTEVLNAYGGRYRITDLLAVERCLHAIDPVLGLTHDGGIAETLASFGFHTRWGEHWTLAQVLAAANSGTPVIVGWPPDRYAGGHLVVVTGGDSAVVTLADSSSWNRHTVSVSQFLAWWGGFAAVATPVE